MKKMLLHSLRMIMALTLLLGFSQSLYSQKTDSLFSKYYENNEDFFKQFNLDSIPSLEQYNNPDIFNYLLPDDELTTEYKIQIFTPWGFVTDNMPIYKPDPTKKYTMRIFDPTKKYKDRSYLSKPFKWFPQLPDK